MNKLPSKNRVDFQRFVYQIRKYASGIFLFQSPLMVIYGVKGVYYNLKEKVMMSRYDEFLDEQIHINVKEFDILDVIVAPLFIIGGIYALIFCVKGFWRYLNTPTKYYLDKWWDRIIEKHKDSLSPKDF